MAKGRNRREQIVQTARELFQKKSYDKTSIQDVMDALGIAKGTVYHYFRSKEDLLEAVVDAIVSESVERMEDQLRSAKGSALDRFKLLIQAGSSAADDQASLDALHGPGNEGMHSRLLAVALTKQAPLYAKLIQQGCDEKIFTTENPLEAAEFLLSGIQFLTDRGIYAWTEEQLSRRIRVFPELVERILGAPKGSFGFLADFLV